MNYSKFTINKVYSGSFSLVSIVNVWKSACVYGENVYNLYM